MKMRSMIVSCVATLSAVSSSAQAWTRYAQSAPVARAAACPRVRSVQVEGTRGYQDALGSGACFVSIDPVETAGSVYRSYAFFDNGLLMVFSSYGDGEDDNPNLTSAREFYFFPRSAKLGLYMDGTAKTVSVRMSDGGRAHIDPATAQLKSLERGTAMVSPRVDPAERGGVEITGYAGLVLDAGFRMGESPSGRPDASSTFRDGQGHLCTVRNRELFSYADGEHTFKFSDPALSAWLRTRCPALTPGF